MMLDTAADAEDVTQTTFLNAYRALLRGERPREPRRWLQVIAHNLCLQHCRLAARRPRQVVLEEDTAALNSDEPDVSVEDLTRAMRQIPVNQRAALVMRELEGRPIAEIADILGLSSSAVETLLFRARRSVREQLEGSLTCAQAEQAISSQLDGALPRAERGPLRAHVRQCEDCAHLARSLRAQRGALKSLAAIPLPGALAWGQFGTSAAVNGITGASAATSVTTGAWLAGSLATKLATATLLAAAVGGVSYEAATNPPWTATRSTPRRRTSRLPGAARPASRTVPSALIPTRSLPLGRLRADPSQALARSSTQQPRAGSPTHPPASAAQHATAGRSHATHGKGARNRHNGTGFQRSPAHRVTPVAHLSKPSHPAAPARPEKPAQPTHAAQPPKPSHGAKLTGSQHHAATPRSDPQPQHPARRQG